MSTVINMVGGGGGGYYPSLFAYGDDLTSSGSATLSKTGKTYNGVWETKQIVNPAYRNLPSGYTQVEWIQSSGTQYINTNITPSASITFEIDMMLFSSISTDYDYTMFGAISTVGRFHFGFPISGRGNEHYSKPFSHPNERFTFSLDSNGVLTDGYSTSTFSAPSSLPSQTCVLFGRYNGDYSRVDTRMTARLYGAKISSSSALTRDYVPCKNSSNVYGLYDLVNNSFVTTPTDTFTAGNIVPQYLTTQGWSFPRIELGTYTLETTQGSLSKQQTILLDVATEYDVEVDFLPSGCIAEYLFDNNTLDTSGNDYDLTGSPTYTDGVKGKCITPSGDLVAQVPVIPTSSNFSISVWAKFNGTSTNNQSNAIFTTTIGTDSSQNSAWWRSGISMNMEANSTSVTQIMGSRNGSGFSNMVEINTWVHIVLTYTYSSNIIAIYKNGTLLDSFTWASLTSHVSNLHVGYGNNTGNSADNFRGSIDLLRIYDKILTTDEISYLYNSGNGR